MRPKEGLRMGRLRICAALALAIAITRGRIEIIDWRMKRSAQCCQRLFFTNLIAKHIRHTAQA